MKSRGMMATQSGENGIFELTIVGGGPAGMSAALEASRQGLSVMIIERNESGGSLRIARKVENFPPWPVASGSFLVELFRKRILRSGVPVLQDEVMALRPSDEKRKYFELELKSGQLRLARTVILATGQKFFLPDELSFLNRFCRFPDQVNLITSGKELEVAIIGGGEVALDQALLYKDMGFKVTVLTRNLLRASRKLLEEFNASKIETVSRSRILLAYKTRSDRTVLGWADCHGNQKSQEFDLVIVACGKKPEYPRMGRSLEKKIIWRSEKLDVGCPVPGLFLAGDLKNGRERYVCLAVADGMRAAREAARYLST